MNLQAVNERLEKIQAYADESDHEEAHSLEDGMYALFVAAIANGDYSVDDIQEIAAKIQTSEEIEFHRWYA